MATPKKKANVGATVVPLDPATGVPVIPQPSRDGLSPDMVPPIPVPLTLPTVPGVAVVPPELLEQAHAFTVDESEEDTSTEDAADESTEDESTVDVNTTEPPVPDIVQHVRDATDTLTEFLPDEALADWFIAVAANLERLTEVVGVVAQQQQWTTDTIAQIQAEFSTVMGSGNPFKAIMNMMGGKKVTPDGR